MIKKNILYLSIVLCIFLSITFFYVHAEEPSEVTFKVNLTDEFGGNLPEEKQPDEINVRTTMAYVDGEFEYEDTITFNRDIVVKTIDEVTDPGVFPSEAQAEEALNILNLWMQENGYERFEDNEKEFVYIEKLNFSYAGDTQNDFNTGVISDIAVRVKDGDKYYIAFYEDNLQSIYRLSPNMPRNDTFLYTKGTALLGGWPISDFYTCDIDASYKYTQEYVDGNTSEIRKYKADVTLDSNEELFFKSENFTKVKSIHEGKMLVESSVEVCDYRFYGLPPMPTPDTYVETTAYLIENIDLYLQASVFGLDENLSTPIDFNVVKNGEIIDTVSLIPEGQNSSGHDTLVYVYSTDPLTLEKEVTISLVPVKNKLYDLVKYTSGFNEEIGRWGWTQYSPIYSENIPSDFIFNDLAPTVSISNYYRGNEQPRIPEYYYVKKSTISIPVNIKMIKTPIFDYTLDRSDSIFQLRKESSAQNVFFFGNYGLRDEDIVEETDEYRLFRKDVEIRSDVAINPEFHMQQYPSYNYKYNLTASQVLDENGIIKEVNITLTPKLADIQTSVPNIWVSGQALETRFEHTVFPIDFIVLDNHGNEVGKLRYNKGKHLSESTSIYNSTSVVYDDLKFTVDEATQEVEKQLYVIPLKNRAYKLVAYPKYEGSALSEEDVPENFEFINDYTPKPYAVSIEERDSIFFTRRPTYSYVYKYQEQMLDIPVTVKIKKDGYKHDTLSSIALYPDYEYWNIDINKDECEVTEDSEYIYWTKVLSLTPTHASELSLYKDQIVFPNAKTNNIYDFTYSQTEDEYSIPETITINVSLKKESYSVTPQLSYTVIREPSTPAVTMKLYGGNTLLYEGSPTYTTSSFVEDTSGLYSSEWKINSSYDVSPSFPTSAYVNLPNLTFTADDIFNRRAILDNFNLETEFEGEYTYSDAFLKEGIDNVVLTTDKYGNLTYIYDGKENPDIKLNVFQHYNILPFNFKLTTETYEYNPNAGYYLSNNGPNRGKGTSIIYGYLNDSHVTGTSIRSGTHLLTYSKTFTLDDLDKAYTFRGEVNLGNNRDLYTVENNNYAYTVRPKLNHNNVIVAEYEEPDPIKIMPLSYTTMAIIRVTGDKYENLSNIKVYAENYDGSNIIETYFPLNSNSYYWDWDLSHKNFYNYDEQSGAYEYYEVTSPINVPISVDTEGNPYEGRAYIKTPLGYQTVYPIHRDYIDLDWKYGAIFNLISVSKYDMAEVNIQKNLLDENNVSVTDNTEIFKFKLKFDYEYVINSNITSTSTIFEKISDTEYIIGITGGGSATVRGLPYDAKIEVEEIDIPNGWVLKNKDEQMYIYNIYSSEGKTKQENYIITFTNKRGTVPIVATGIISHTPNLMLGLCLLIGCMRMIFKKLES